MVDWAAHLGVVLERLGEDVTFTHGTGAPTTVRGLFENSYLAGDVGQVGVSGTNPRFSALSSVLGEVDPGDTITRAAVTYRVRAVRPDDPGGVTVLELKRT